MIKKGDTLIEVTIAVGIFSMIAIAVTSVMSSGTSDAQTALETTLAREEIDAQAEALRFIQASYIADKGIEGNSKYPELWKKITESALENPSSAVLQYAPTSCQELYDTANENNITKQHAFILNTRKLGNFTSTDDVFVSAANDTGNKKIFNSASIYPRLIYNGEDNQALINSGTITNLSRAEGIYIVAVRDNETTKTVDATGAVKNSAFYDFYIRTCWYGSNANEPSTISTVIRLHDPDVIAERPGAYLVFRPNGGSGSMEPIFVPTGKSVTLPANKFNYKGLPEDLYSFCGWSTNQFATKKDFEDNAQGTYKAEVDTYTVPSTGSKKDHINMYAIWDVDRFWVDVNMERNGETNNSGFDIFTIKSYIDGIAVDKEIDKQIVDGTQVSIKDWDFYQPVNYGSEMKIEVLDHDDYELANTGNICQDLRNNGNPCEVKHNDDKNLTEITFTVKNVIAGQPINDSNQKALNILLEWVAK